MMRPQPSHRVSAPVSRRAVVLAHHRPALDFRVRKVRARLFVVRAHQPGAVFRRQHLVPRHQKHHAAFVRLALEQLAQCRAVWIRPDHHELRPNRPPARVHKVLCFRNRVEYVNPALAMLVLLPVRLDQLRKRAVFKVRVLVQLHAVVGGGLEVTPRRFRLEPDFIQRLKLHFHADFALVFLILAFLIRELHPPRKSLLREQPFCGHNVAPEHGIARHRAFNLCGRH
mmetsp:Transcript_10798/g.22985  ORF Transcript_10798/g.22985 Transcript_10798/m.22985 type:complete len:227 (-) Transcript_10798:283-963(-)